MLTFTNIRKQPGSITVLSNMKMLVCEGELVHEMGLRSSHSGFCMRSLQVGYFDTWQVRDTVHIIFRNYWVHDDGIRFIPGCKPTFEVFCVKTTRVHKKTTIGMALVRIQRFVRRHIIQQRRLAMCMGLHGRLGGGSWVSILPDHLLQGLLG